MAGLEGLLRKGMPLGLVAVLGCHGGRDSGQPDDTGRDSSYDSGETGDTHTGDTDTSTSCYAPTLTSSSSEIAYVGEQFSYQVTTSDSGQLRCRFDDAPLDVTFTSECSFTYTSSDFDVGQYTFNFEYYLEGCEDEETEGSLALTIADSSTNTAPVIETTSLSSATVNTAYSATVSATDAEGDALTYSIVDGPSWLSINSSGRLSGTPSTSGTETVEVKVADTDGLYDTATYSLLVASVASVDMYVIDGDDGAAADSSCSIDVTLTNSTSGYSSTVTMDASGVSAFSLDEDGLYNISIPSTNTGSNCYGGVSLDEWIDVSAGTNSGWVTLIPESYQDDVVDVVGSQITTYRDGSAWTCDSVTDLVKYMTGVWSVSPYVEGWESNIRDGTYDLEIEDFNGYTYSGIDYDSALADAVALWDGSLAPSITIVASGSGGDIYWTLTGNWDTDPNTNSSTGVISNVEIEYGGAGSYATVVETQAHEIGHSFFEHTPVDEFIMKDSHTADEPHELELLTARIYNNIGPQSPTGDRVDLYNGYSE